MGSLLQEMKGSHIVHFLEVLSANKVPEHLIRRYRLDGEFAEKISGLMIIEHLKNPGRKLFIRINSSWSRAQLNIELAKRGVMTLRQDIVESFMPKAISSKLVQEIPIDGTKTTEELKVFLVSLYRDTNASEAVAILDDIGLESVTVEEALVFALQTRSLSFSQYYSIVVLSGKYIGDIVEEEDPVRFLNFGVTLSGDASISLCRSDFSLKTLFLVKRKKSQYKRMIKK